MHALRLRPLVSTAPGPVVCPWPHGLAGEDKVCLGTDYPFPLGEFTAESRGKDYAPGTLIDSMEWEAGVKDKLLSLNACNWLGVTPERFL